MRQAYDIVVIGAGHNGLAAAIALAGARYSVGVFEARAQVGGCAITTEPLGPGFRHSPHANSFLFADVQPRGLAPGNLGVSLLQPEAQLGVAFADGRPPVILHRPDLLARTWASLAAYSEAEASTYVDLKRRSAALGPVVRQGLYAPPDARWFEAQHRAVLRAYGPLCDPPRLGQRSARQLIDGLFETPEIRLLLYVLATETGVTLEDPGGDLGFLGLSLWLAGRWRFPVGGMQAYADALLGAARATGVEVAVSTPIARVVTQDGRARGVRTVAGDEIEAAIAVVAATPILQVFDQLLVREQVSPAEQADVAAFRRTPGASIGTSAFALAQAPRYKSGRHDPEIDRCLKTAIGFERPFDVLDQAADARAGRLPRPAGIVRVHSLWDPGLAPPGGHLAAIDTGFPAMSVLDRETWASVAAAFPAALFETWQGGLAEAMDAPPMTMTLDDTLGFERRMLLRLGDAQHRTSVAGLYLAGPGVYPGGGVHGACGHNAAATVIGDHRPAGARPRSGRQGGGRPGRA